MPRMVPATARSGANVSERRLFTAVEGIMHRPDWVVFHSLVVRQHVDQLTGEADFVVAAPGRGLVVIEAKAPSGVHYHDGQWTLEGVPQPHKNPFEQLDGAMRSIRGYLLREGVIEGDEPIARLVWFTSIGRHHFTARAPSDLSFFEWELAWADDLAHPAAAIERVLDEHIAWHATGQKVRHRPDGVTAERIAAITSGLTRDFDVVADDRDARREAERLEAEVLAEQRFALELLGTNPAVYFDGPAGTGKSHLLVQAAIESVQRGERTLLTCWNVVMAEQLAAEARHAVTGPLAAADLGTVMLWAAGLEAHPEDAPDAWYQEELPRLALAGLAAHPERGGYRHVIVDEFQDIAGNPRLLDVLLALAAPDARCMFAGDTRQQIMRKASARVDPHQAAKARWPGIVHARIRRNCRQAPALVAQAERIVGRPFGFLRHRLAGSTPGGAQQLQVSPGKEVPMLAGVLKLLTEQHRAADIVVLSPWGSRSTAARIVSGELDDPAHREDLRWLRAHLGEGADRVRFGSIFKLKGIEADAVVITDIGTNARAWADAQDLSWDDLLYVGLTRARFRAVVLEAV